MKRNLRNKIVFGLMTNEINIKIRDIKYVIRNVSSVIRFEAEEIYDRTVHDNRFSLWLTDKDALAILVNNDLCSTDIDSNMKEIEKVVEDHKVRLFKASFDTDAVKKIKHTLGMVRKKQEQMMETRFSLDHLTIHGFGEMVKQQFLMFHSLYNMDGSRFWNDPKDVNIRLMELAMLENTKAKLTVSIFREIARTDPWRSYWGVDKSNPFGTSALQLTEDQRTLIMFTKMYDNAYEHPECPPQDIMADDDMFDGWMIANQRKNEKEKMTHQLEDRFARHGDAQEIFIPVKNREQARKINELNDTRGTIVKAQRKAALHRSGKLTDSQLPDKRIEIQAQANKQFIEQVKGK